MLRDYNRAARWYWWLLTLAGGVTLAWAAWELGRMPGAQQAQVLGGAAIAMVVGPAAASVAMLVCGLAQQALMQALQGVGYVGDGTVFVATLVFALLYFGVSPTLVTTVIYLKRRRAPTAGEWLSNFGWVGMGYFASASIAAVLFLASHQFGLTAVAVAVPMIGMLADSHGHGVGDRFLVAIANRIRALVRPGDVLARVGGDDFGVLALHRGGGTHHAVALAERLQAAFEAPVIVDEVEVHTGATVGITFSEIGDVEADEVLRDANLAMTHARSSGRARYALFDPDLHARAADRLALEITETSLMQQLEMGAWALKALREIGIGLSVDDFGTDYSSLSRLSTLPITSLKIDRSFVDRLDGMSGESEIVRTVIQLGRALGKRVVAEGVESAEQLERLRQLGCGFVQGYLLSRPLAEAQATMLLEEQLQINRSNRVEALEPG